MNKSNTVSTSSLSKNNLDLSESDLQVLLQNFYKLEGEEQQILITHLKKLEQRSPDLVENLKKYVRVASPEPNDDSDLNDLDDLDDILEETATLITDLDSEDDCSCIKVQITGVATETSQKSTTKKIVKTAEPTETIIELLEKSAEKILNIKREKIKINLLPKETSKNSSTNNKINNLIKEPGAITHEISSRKIESPTGSKCLMKENNKDKNRKINLYSAKIKSAPTNYVDLSINNPFVKHNVDRKRDQMRNLVENEMQAKYFGYRSYDEMQEYLQKTGIYCERNPYFSFADNE